jgi:hypothetical protein
MSRRDVSVGITLGSGQELAITDDDHLIVIDHAGYRIDLGRATKRRFADLREYVERLAIHAVEEEVLK